MRNIKCIWILITIVIPILLMPAAPVSAQIVRSIELEPQKGRIGDTITIVGQGFNKSTDMGDKYAAIFFSSQEATTINDIDTDVTVYELVRDGVWLDYEGSFKTSFIVPSKLTGGKLSEDVTTGTYYVYVCHYLSSFPPTFMPRIRGTATFTVTKGEITLSPRNGPVGTLVEITGIDFRSRKDLAFKYDGLSVPIESGSRQTDNDGDFISVIRVPDSTAGTHIITALDSGTEATANFSIKPEITISPTSGEINTKVIVRGTGFGGGTQVNISFHAIGVATATTSSQGSFFKSFVVPDLEAGAYTIKTEGETNVATTRFTITAPPLADISLSTSISSGSIGQALVITGAGFRTNTIVIVKYDGEIVATTTTNNNGIFAATFAVPSSKYGQHKISATDGTSVEELIFTVESSSPSIPTLLQPEMEAKIKPPISFDWVDVIDDSRPVTYILQIATGNDFAPTFILLEQRSISKSVYQLTSEDMRKLASGKLPYYWRVKAVDGASNEGQWTYGSMFYIATAFPSWGWYIIIVLGVLLLIGIGFLLSIKIGLPRRKGTID